MARKHFGLFVQYVDRTFSAGWVHALVCNALDQFLADVVEKRSPRLMITMPPRHGKSQLVSRLFPAFALGRFPDLSFIGTSYSAGLADSFSKDIQRIIDSDEYRAVFPDTQLGTGKTGDALRQTSVFEIRGHKGRYRSAGVGGGITGHGGECVAEDSEVLTPFGYRSIKNILPGCPVIGYNINTHQLEVCIVEAKREKYAEKIHRLRSYQGRSLKVTGNHPIYSQGRFVPAETLTKGAPILCAMRKRICRDGLSIHQEREKRTGAAFLLSFLFDEARIRERGESAQVQGLRSLGKEGTAILHGMPSEASAMAARNGTATCAEGLSDLWQCVCRSASWAWRVCRLLFQRLQEYCSIVNDGGFWKSEIQRRNYGFAQSEEHHKCAVSRQESRFSKIRKYLFGLRFNGKNPMSSFGFEPFEQQSRQCCDRVRGMPQGMPSARSPWYVYGDAVSSNSEEYGEFLVVDLQVSKCHNFFANGILVHNCLLVDDPFKDHEDADSATQREKVWNWYTSTLYTRKAPGAGIIVINTRWHCDDLSGKLLDAEARGQGDKWQVLNFPAIAEHDERYRKTGEALHPERYDLQSLEQIKTAIGSRDWQALYQQHPVPDGGALFKAEWLKHWSAATLPTMDRIIESWDMTFKDGAHSDFVVGQVWGKKGANYYLLDQVRGRWDFVHTLSMVRLLSQNHPKAWTKLVEEKANGAAVMSSLHSTVGGFVPIVPKESKEARAFAITPLFESGNVYLPPLETDWVHRDLIPELMQFPSGAHDDQVDAMTQALSYLKEFGSGYAIGDD